MATSRAPPITNPTAVPVSARSAVEPVEAALVRSTDRVPSTTQNPCWTPERSATVTATAIASAPRRLLMNHTERRLAWRAATPAYLVTPARRRSSPGPRAWSPNQRVRAAITQSASSSPAASRLSAPITSAVTAIAWAWNDICCCSRKSPSAGVSACTRAMASRRHCSRRSRSGLRSRSPPNSRPASRSTSAATTRTSRSAGLAPLRSLRS